MASSTCWPTILGKLRTGSGFDESRRQPERGKDQRAACPSQSDGTKAWGEIRPTGSSTLPTTYRFTGQRQEETIKLYWYNSRWYDDALGRFIQPDTIVPLASQGVQAWDRYAYANNSPVVFSDPTGHCTDLSNCIEDIIVGAALTVLAPVSVWTQNPFQGVRDESGKNLDSSLSTTRGGVPDITSWMVDTLNSNASGPIAGALSEANSGGIQGKYAALVGWQAMVQPHAPWDYKDIFNQRGVKDVILGGQKFNMEAIANITFGYVGRASGFSGGTLLMGAGAAQAISDLWSHHTINFNDAAYFFDQPYDQRAILFGILLYEKYQGTGITMDDFEDFIQEYGYLLHPPEDDEKAE